MANVYEKGRQARSIKQDSLEIRGTKFSLQSGIHRQPTTRVTWEDIMAEEDPVEAHRKLRLMNPLASPKTMALRVKG